MRGEGVESGVEVLALSCVGSSAIPYAYFLLRKTLYFG